MMKQILNNLWSQRTQNVWLFIELVVVCFVAWTQLDPIAVRLYYKSLPKGFDSERLVVANTRTTDIQWIDDDSYNTNRAFVQKMIKQKLQTLDEVEQVSLLGQIQGLLAPRNIFNGSSWVDQEGEQYIYGNDTILVYELCYIKNEHFFETYGIQVADGSPTAKELSKLDDDGVVISRSIAEHFFGSAKDAIGKEIFEADIMMSRRIRGVVEDIHVSDSNFDTWQIYQSTSDIKMIFISNHLTIRLKPDVNVQQFIEKYNCLQQFATDGLAIAFFTPYEDIATPKNQFATPILSYDFNLSVATAIFFLINLCLGVIGTFWMQTKRRTEESGIMRAFGSTKRRIMGMFLAEGFVLTTFSMFITCILYLNYVKTGLGTLCIPPHEPYAQPDPTWVADKPLHFLIISGIVYLIILITVSIGITIPAWNIVRTKPVEALREE